MIRFLVAALLSIAFASYDTPAYAALVQWDLVGVNSYQCIPQGFCGDPILRTPPTDKLTGSFVYNTLSKAVVDWDITSQSFGTTWSTGNSFNDSSDSVIGFHEILPGGMKEIAVTLYLASADSSQL